MNNTKNKVQCPHCESSNVVKNGIKNTGKQNFLCKSCRKQFQSVYQNRGSNPRIRKQIKRSLINGSGIRDCSVVFEVCQKCVLNVLINCAESIKIGSPKKRHYHSIQIDEMYSFVQKKDKKVWIFYAYAPETKEILAFTMGKRNIRQVEYLMIKLKVLGIRIDNWCTDSFKGFITVLRAKNHLIGKEYTKAIEGRNTDIRAKLARFQRRSTKFSKKLIFQWNLFKIYVHCLNNNRSYIT